MLSQETISHARVILIIERDGSVLVEKNRYGLRGYVDADERKHIAELILRAPDKSEERQLNRISAARKNEQIAKHERGECRCGKANLSGGVSSDIRCRYWGIVPDK